jgi:hypothetical protein
MTARYLTVADLTAQLQVHKNTIRTWTKSGILTRLSGSTGPPADACLTSSRPGLRST